MAVSSPRQTAHGASARAIRCSGRAPIERVAGGVAVATQLSAHGVVVPLTGLQAFDDNGERPGVR